MKRSVISIVLIVLLVGFLLPLDIITRDLVSSQDSVTWSYEEHHRVRFVNGWTATLPEGWSGTAEIYDGPEGDLEGQEVELFGKGEERYTVSVTTFGEARGSLASTKKLSESGEMPAVMSTTRYKGCKVDFWYWGHGSKVTSGIYLYSNDVDVLDIEGDGDPVLNKMIARGASSHEIATYIIERVGLHRTETWAVR